MLQYLPLMKNLVLLSLGFVLIFNLIFFDTDIGLGTGLLFLFLNLFYFLIKGKESMNLKIALASSVGSVLFAFLVSLRSSEIIQILNLLLASFFSLSALYFYKSQSTFSFEIPKFILIPLDVLTNSISSILKFLTLDKISQGQDNKPAASLVRGLIITIPIFTILLLLLTHADPVFNKLVGDFLENIWQRILVSIFIFVGLISFGVAKLNERVSKEEMSQETERSYELIILIGSLVFLFAVFILIQFRYFFSNVGERELQRLGITSLTYSEYVRKGFFELLAASTLASLVMIYVMKHLHNLKGRYKAWMQIISSTLILEIGLLLLSAAQRINLYQTAHGLTRARVFGFIFLVWLGLMLAILLIRVVKELKKEWLFNLTLLSSTVVLLSVSVLDIDGLIAAKYKPSVNGEIDYYYLTSISPDAFESWNAGLLESKKVIDRLYPVKKLSAEDYRQLFWAKSTLYSLNNHINYLSDKYGSYQKFLESTKGKDEATKKKILKNGNRIRKWQSFNLGGYKAYQYILENKNSFDQVPELIKKAEYLDSIISDDIRNIAPLDRSTQPPLI